MAPIKQKKVEIISVVLFLFLVSVLASPLVLP